MDVFFERALMLVAQSINTVGNWVIDVMGEFAFTVVFASGITFVIYRLLIKPLTGYGVSSDTAKPRKEEKGE